MNREAEVCCVDVIIFAAEQISAATCLPACVSVCVSACVCACVCVCLLVVDILPCTNWPARARSRVSSSLYYILLTPESSLSMVGEIVIYPTIQQSVTSHRYN